MLTTQQTTQNILEHGISVHKYFNDLIGENKLDWKLPDWFEEHKEFILNNLHKYDDIEEYQKMHDCGKPYCLYVDEEGRNHFPDHSNISSQVFSKISNNIIVKDLISKDMIFHTIRSEDLKNFIDKTSIETVLTLLTTSFCELHSNANMFGGIKSQSFLIKLKKTSKLGKKTIHMIMDKNKKQKTK